MTSEGPCPDVTIIVISIVWDTAGCPTALQNFIYAKKVVFAALVVTLCRINTNAHIMMSPDACNSTLNLAEYKLFLISLQVRETLVVHVTHKSHRESSSVYVCVGNHDNGLFVMYVTSQTADCIEYFSSSTL
jgi:hypothetical protein